ncbi:MAG: PAS domain S-box protein [Caulobacterales bacterium]
MGAPQATIDESEAPAPRTPDDLLGRLAGSRVANHLAFAIIVYLAALPFAGWPMPMMWLVVMAALIGGEHARAARQTDDPDGDDYDGGVFTWLQSAGYSIAALCFVLFYTGVPQTFGVTLFGVIMFRILVRHYANTRRLALNLVAPVACMVLAQGAAAFGILAHHAPVQILTLLASPCIVFMVFRTVQADLTRNRRRLIDASASAEAAARRIQEAHRIALMAEETAGVGHWRMDVATRVSNWSDGVFRIYGLEPSGAVPSNAEILAMYSPNDRDMVLAHLRKILADGTPFTYEAAITRPNGEVRHVMSNGAAERNAAGEVVTVFGIFMDVTDAHARELALRESEAHLRMLAEHSTDLVIWMSPGGTILYASPSVKGFGYAPDDVLGRKTIDFVHPDDRERAADIIRELFANQSVDRTVRREYRVRTRDGRYVWLEGNPTLILGAEGRVTSAVTSYRDVSARHQLEDDLLDAKLRAEAAAEAKAEFLANMSHEIRTPLTGIIGFSGLLGEIDDLPETAKTYVRRITTSGEALLAVVNDILDFSKLEAGQVVLDPQPFDLRRFFADTLSIFSELAAAKLLDLRLEVDSAAPATIEADSARLRQVLVNLLSNAIKFTDQGQVRVTATYEAADQQLWVAVADTGAGVPEDKLGRLFQRFSQVDGSVSRRHGGTGLGLSICRNLVELMGGEIDVSSTLGAGSTFRFHIAAARADDAAVDADLAAVAAQTDVPPSSILIVDDLDVNRELIGAVLRAMGHSVEEAASGAEAVKAAISHPFDLIFMDLQMPGMDGFASARAIRNLASANRLTPIVALSANVLPEHVEASAAAGMNDHVAKPIAPAELVAALSRWSGVRLDETSGGDEEAYA